MRPALRPLAAAAVVMLGGCSVGGLGGGSQPAPAAAPAVEMAGRWTFAAASGGACAMNFVGAAATEGDIRPEGGCPGNFYTSRKWSFEGGSLVVRDHNGQALAQLRSAGPSRFEGQAAAGGPVTLTR